ncbi:conserved hypothetical protein [Rhodospirillaceae bacterium LM-1]|nr:conserved hypothetical protein [Rhodospirillaceae bacterium LM-1]
MLTPPFQIRKVIGDDYNVDPDDTLNTKQALNRLGYYAPPQSYGMTPYPDRLMFNSLKAFQKDMGLKIDGLMRPGGPTEAQIGLRLAENERDKFNKPVPMPSHQGNNQKDCNASGRGWDRIDEYTARDPNTGAIYKCKPRPWYDPRDNWQDTGERNNNPLPPYRRK